MQRFIKLYQHEITALQEQLHSTHQWYQFIYSITETEYMGDNGQTVFICTDQILAELDEFHLIH